MNPPGGIFLRPCSAADASVIAALLNQARPEYLQFFHPFAYEEPVIADLLSRNLRDAWFLLETRQGSEISAAGFYMLRGLDEGFTEPMYGVFVAEEYSRLGLGRLTLAHAEEYCLANGLDALLLKVNPENERALRMYTNAGFSFLRIDPRNGENVLRKPLRPR